MIHSLIIDDKEMDPFILFHELVKNLNIKDQKGKGKITIYDSNVCSTV